MHLTIIFHVGQYMEHISKYDLKNMNPKTYLPVCYRQKEKQTLRCFIYDQSLEL